MAGESHVGDDKILRNKRMWILKVSACGLQGDADGTVCGLLFGFGGPPWRQCAARPDRAVVHCASGHALNNSSVRSFIALLATLCGATSRCDMALFARTKEGLLRSVLDLKFGPPSHDTFSRVFRLLDPKGFDKAFQGFMKAFSAHLKLQRTKGVVAIDGKALRCAYERGRSHMPALIV